MNLQEPTTRECLKFGVLIASEQDPVRLLDKILTSMMELANCDAGTLYMPDYILGEEKTLSEGPSYEKVLRFKLVYNHSLRFRVGHDGTNLNIPPVPLDRKNVCAYAFLEHRTINLKDAYECGEYDFTGSKKYDRLTGYHTCSMLTVPLIDQRGQGVDVIQLINAMDSNGKICAFSDGLVSILELLAELAAAEIRDTWNMRSMLTLLNAVGKMAFVNDEEEMRDYPGSAADEKAYQISVMLENQRMMDIFSRYMAPEIMNEVLKDENQPLQLGGKRTDIAILFVDLHNFTQMSETMSPELVCEILNRCLSLLSDCVRKYGGIVDKYIGDCVMAFWGATLPQKDYTMLAVRAAMDMIESMKTLSEVISRKYGQTLSIRVGVHAGEAVVGNIGSIDRMDYTVIGDTVNTATRLEESAEVGTVYISREIVDRLGNRIKARSLGTSVKLKGKSDDFEVFVLEDV